MNLFHYVKQYGSYSFEEEPFNEVDNIILSQIPYLPLDNIVYGFNIKAISLSEVVKKMVEHNSKKKVKGIFCNRVYKLILKMQYTKRYKDILCYHYKKEIDRDSQFGAITLRLPDGSIFISYEGTNSSISGWKEDACMTYRFPVPAQVLALNYLKKTVSMHDSKIRIGGHSKGGNLAIYAAMEAPHRIQKKIIKVYDNDGPGFFKELVESDKYQRIVKKIYRIVPRESVVGMLLYHSADTLVVKSKSKSVLQHDPFHWQVEGTSFVVDSLSEYSKRVSEKTKCWIENLRIQERKRCVEDLFDTLAFSDVVDTYDFFSIGKSIATLREIKHLEDSSKKSLIEAVKIIV